MAEQFSLILGCGGSSHHNIILCSGTSNVVFNFNRHFDPVENKKLMDFLDFACNLFDAPMGDWNKIVNTLKMLRDHFKLLDDKLWQALHMWLPQHKRCGAYMRLVFNADIPNFVSYEAFVEPSFITSPQLPVLEVEQLIEKPPKKQKKPKFEKKILAPEFKSKKHKI